MFALPTLRAVMFTAAAVVTGIQRVGAVVSVVGTVLTLPSGILAGDTILVYGFNATSTTSVATPSGYTTRRNTAGTTIYHRLASKIAVGGETSVTMTGATHMIARVYRGCTVGNSAQGSGTTSTATVSYSGVSPLNVTTGTSWIVSFGGHKSASNMNLPPAGETNQGSVGTGPMVAVHDTNGGVTSFTTRTVTVNASDYYNTASIELVLT